MTCLQARDLLPLYLNEILDRRDMEAVARHLERCIDCRAWLGQQGEHTIMSVTPDRRVAAGASGDATAHDGHGRVQRVVRVLVHSLGW